MSREIKFRAWDGKEYHYQEEQYLTSFLRRFIRDINYDKDVMSNHESYLDNNLDSYLQQYTGIKDKNGKKIYEGDIIRASNAVGIVIFLEGCFIIDWGRYAIIGGVVHRNIYLPTWIDGMTIIGNIYENKDLLKNA